MEQITKKVVVSATNTKAQAFFDDLGKKKEAMKERMARLEKTIASRQHTNSENH